MNPHIQDIGIDDLRKMLRPRPVEAHKGTMGHALLVSGSRGMAGATILASEACLRSGIGKLSLLTAEDNRIILQISVPEAIVLSDFPTLFPYEAVGIGPGMGRSFDILHACLEAISRPMVLDADALNMLGEKPEWSTLIPTKSILTPHLKEAERLTGSSNLCDVATYAAHHHIYIILKGHPTHLCTPKGTIFRLSVGNPGMATAGSGDVLTGIVTGLLAQGYTPEAAALLGIWLHGTAGDFACDEMGENCMLARDIIRHLSKAFQLLTIDD